MLETVLQYGTGTRRRDRPVRGRQDGHHLQLRRRLVRRLGLQVHGRRVGRLPQQADPDDHRLQRRPGARRHLPGADLARLHDLGAADRQDPRGSRRRQAGRHAARPRPPRATGPPKKRARRASPAHRARPGLDARAPPARRNGEALDAERRRQRSRRRRRRPPAPNTPRRAVHAGARARSAQRPPSARRRPRRRRRLRPRPRRPAASAPAASAEPRPRPRDVAVAGRAEAPGQLDRAGDADARALRATGGLAPVAGARADAHRAARRGCWRSAPA